ncbi:MAG TPA: pyruvate, water dikinase regulatory protein [Bacteroidales bacterium]|nr:pyruvate, water dikinase regulatory protein [Bacteroidales bacterium]
MNRIFVISDGTGRTAEQTLMAALTQFPNAQVEIVLKQEIRTEQQIAEIMPEIEEAKGIIVHTLVSESLREFIVKHSRIHNVDAIDLMGPLLSRLSHHLANSPSGEPGLFFRLNKEYFKRIDSMQFAFTHDDGQRYTEYEKAEIILVGVSRTFKTPLCIFLAFKGWFVANYPIVLGVDPPELLGRIPPGHIFGLTTQAGDLSSLRSVRQEYLGGCAGEYASLEYVKKELNYAQEIFSRYQWPVISVTHKPIEEIASEILAIKRRINPPEYHRKKYV